MTQLRPPKTYESMLADCTNCFHIKAYKKPLPAQYL